MIGFYDYTVWLTYISLMTSAYGIIASIRGEIFAPVLCLALSGFFDAFDGMIARTKKDRTVIQKNFGIQIDSLSDIVCFGIGPAAIGYNMGMKDGLGIFILLIYCTAGLVRLAYFNVTEEERQKETAEKRHTYQGLPITSASFILPLFYLLTRFFEFEPAPAVYFVMGATGLCFVINFRVPKPGLKEILGMGALVLIAGLAVFIFHG